MRDRHIFFTWIVFLKQITVSVQEATSLFEAGEIKSCQTIGLTAACNRYKSLSAAIVLWCICKTSPAQTRRRFQIIHLSVSAGTHDWQVHEKECGLFRKIKAGVLLSNTEVDTLVHF
ncbi:hypothetical protein AVEN_34517-1 [Araneus ventricosus]|uniref:Uncharacterized protein n=1 Tax=Araneus ventricosus TaxID=182803 RepID=A0A4Y2RCM0_ARAVE|nr:hypothetical protein AVEN_34517-1 [Araneus ventricosus]